MRIFVCLFAGACLFSCDAENKPCDDVTCSDHGICVAFDTSPRCACDDGYRATGLACLPVASDGDGDADAEWVTVPAGTFTMGSPTDEAGRDDGELQHEVTLTRAFRMQATEVTRDQFAALLGYDPTGEEDPRCGGDCPVGRATWHEATAYCNALSDRDGRRRCYSCNGSGRDVSCELTAELATPYDCLGYRLPTEAEWEYAARAGTTTATYSGDLDDGHLECETPNAALSAIAWWCGNGPARDDVLVAQLEPNAWGLYDMLGNRLEATGDWRGDYPTATAENPVGAPDGDRRVYRGGEGYMQARFCRAAARHMFSPDVSLNLGLRPVRSLH